MLTAVRRILIVMTLMMTTVAFGHGVEYSTFQGGVGIQVAYDHGAPMAASTVAVYAPADQENPFLQGVTDKHGRFVFAPDAPGEWRVEVEDATGHGLVQHITVSQEMIPEIHEEHHLSLGQQILMGISIIFGITGIGYYVSARKVTADKE